MNVYNNQAPVSCLGFFGDAPAAHAFCTSSIETLSIWSLQEGRQLQHFTQIRREPVDDDVPAAVEQADGIDFLVGCQWDAAQQLLWLLAGDHSGTVHLLRVDADSLEVAQSLRPSPAGGHTSGVRAFHWAPGSLLTGGEDGRLCLWGEPPVASLPAAQPQKMRPSEKASRKAPY